LYLHYNQIAHLDLKPNNIILDEECNPFLIDFGLSSFIASLTSSDSIGTEGYKAPEIGNEGRDPKKCDIYSFGV